MISISMAAFWDDVILGIDGRPKDYVMSDFPKDYVMSDFIEGEP